LRLVVLAMVCLCTQLYSSRAQQQPSFESDIKPFFTKTCVFCHNSKMKSGNLDLQQLTSTPRFLEDREAWEHVVKKLKTGEMPPKGLPRPEAADVERVTAWINSEIDKVDATTKPDPGRVTIRRLNREEYNNTVRDLLGVQSRPANDFPQDDSGYGFDNIGDVLSLSPVLMEKYVAAAEKAARSAIMAGPSIQPTVERYSAEKLKQVGGIRTQHRFPAEAEYDLRAGLGGIRPDGSPVVKLALSLDGVQIKLFEVDPARHKPRTFDVRSPVKAD